MTSASKRQATTPDPGVGDVRNVTTPNQTGLYALALAAAVTESQSSDDLATRITDNNNGTFGSPNRDSNSICIAQRLTPGQFCLYHTATKITSPLLKPPDLSGKLSTRFQTHLQQVHSKFRRRQEKQPYEMKEKDFCFQLRRVSQRYAIVSDRSTWHPMLTEYYQNGIVFMRSKFEGQFLVKGQSIALGLVFKILDLYLTRTKGLCL